MRIILILAVLALTNQAVSSFDLDGFQNALADKLNLDVQQRQNLNQCISSGIDIGKIVAEFMQTQSKYGQSMPKPEELQSILMIAGIQYGPQIMKLCGPIFSDLESLVTEKDQDIFMSNLAKNAPYIIQKLINIADLSMSGTEDYQSGQVLGDILRIILGLEKPEQLPFPEIHPENTISFETERFNTEFYVTLFGELGIKDELLSMAFGKCTNELVAKFENYAKLDDDIDSPALDPRRLASYYDMTKGKTVYCEPAFSYLMITPWFRKALLRASMSDPLVMLNKFGETLPTTSVTLVSIAKDIAEGRYAEAGGRTASVFQTLADLAEPMDVEL